MYTAGRADAVQMYAGGRDAAPDELPLVVRILSTREHMVTVEPQSYDHCGEGLGMLGWWAQLEVDVRDSDLAEVTLSSVDCDFADGTSIVVPAGVPYSGGEVTAWIVLKDDWALARFPVDLERTQVGRSYTRHEPIELLPATAGSAGPRAYATLGGRPIELPPTTLLGPATARPDGVIAAIGGMCVRADLYVENAAVTAGVETLNRPREAGILGLIPSNQVDQGTVIYWRDGAKAGRVRSNRGFNSVPEDVEGRLCFAPEDHAGWFPVAQAFCFDRDTVER